jgi:phage terminase large subunit
MTATIDIDVDEIMNEWSIPLLDEQSRYLILYGGAGSGKSVTAAQKIIIRCLEEKGHKFLVVRKVANTMRNSVFSLLRGTIAEWGLSELFKVNKSDMDITCVNGNQIIFAGLDDVEKLKSVHGVTGMWLEEASEMLQEDFQQLDLRLRGQTKYYKQIMISFNPISITHWLKLVFFDLKKSNSKVIHTTYKDNTFIDDEYKSTLEALKEQDPYYYSVYALGEWGVTGKTIFNAQKVNERISYLRQHNPVLKRGYFDYKKDVADKIKDETISWIDDPDGSIHVFEEPKNRYPYVIGGDTAGDGSDNFTGQAINNITGKQVARLRQTFDEDLYAEQMYCLGKYYNYALLSIETNFSTHPVKVLTRLGYSNMFIREREDTYTGSIQKTYGFNTNKLTRASALAILVAIVRENVDWINDMDTLFEMLTFVRDEKGKAAAQEGSKDDLILGLAIGYYSRGQQDEKLFEEAVVEYVTPFPFRTEEPSEGGFMKW